MLRGILNHNSSFIFVTSNEYDRDIDILNSNDFKFNASIVRMVEPGMIQVFDIQICQNDKGFEQGLIKILINQDSYLFLDTIDISLCTEKTRKQAHINTNVYQMYRAYGFNWPYFSYISKFNFVFIMNAFNSKFIQRYELPKNIRQIYRTFLTDSKDFFCIAVTTENIYQVFTINLDSDEPTL